MPKKLEKVKRKNGRPSIYTEKLGDEICEVVSTSNDMLETLCNERKHWPTAPHVYKWRRRMPKFGLRYAIAKQEQVDALVSNSVSKVRNKDNDFYYDSDGKKAINSAAMQRLRIEVDLIKWYAAKVAPKIYGDLVTVEALKDKNAELNRELEELRAQLDEKNKREY